jgi:phosphoribosyl-ATP pyrophosphohydrolase/phosphoribosyl-AMP cyclohydrolase
MNAINFDKMEGLVPAIVQDATTGQVLMLGFMDREAYAISVRSGFVTFFSRSRQALWTKGESSGNRLQIVSAATDCDSDSLLFKVHVRGAGLVCHEGVRSCFSRAIPVRRSTDHIAVRGSST